MDITVVIPLFNEEDSIGELTRWINQIMKSHQFSYEIIMVDDGSTDRSWNVIEQLTEQYTELRAIKFRRNYGKSAALHTGFQSAKGDVVVTMDADLQDSPEEIPELYRMIMEDQYDLISGWKKKRYDPVSKTIPSKLFNATARKFTGIQLHDFNCGLKAYRNKVVKNIEIFGEMHRYIPVLAKKAGFQKIGEKVVQHQKRKYGVTKFGFERFINGFLDLMTILFISKFGKRPMHFFGTLGTLMFLVGFLLALGMGIHKIYSLQFMNEKIRLVADNPLFYISLTAMIIGTQLFLSGFLGELVSRSSSHRNEYIIEQEL